jgi:fucose 4-O-acetylase-like acetyltransferase
MGTQTRLSWIDTAKGIAIICVVYGHCLRGLTSGGLIAADASIQVTDYLVYTFHMPLFFVASGLFFASSYSRGTGPFWTGRLQTIVYPYFLWSLIQGSVQLLLSGTGVTNWGMDWGRLGSIPWLPIAPFWFLFALFFSNVLAVALIRIRPALVVALALMAFLLSRHLASWVVQDVCYGFLYFALGMLVREYGLLSSLPTSPFQVGALFAAFAALTLLAFALGMPERLPIYASVVSVAAVAALGALVERRSPGRPLTALLRICGQYSMGIFVLHILVLGFTRTVMVRLGHVENGAVLLIMATALGVLVPLAVQHAAVRLGVHKWIGLPASTVPTRAHDSSTR